MTNVQQVRIQQIKSSVLTDSDINRMPVTKPKKNKDKIEHRKKISPVVKKSVLAILLCSVVIVGLKHCPFMKFNPDDMTFFNKYFKRPVSRLGDCIEAPFKKFIKWLDGEDIKSKKKHKKTNRDDGVFCDDYVATSVANELEHAADSAGDDLVTCLCG